MAGAYDPLPGTSTQEIRPCQRLFASVTDEAEAQCLVRLGPGIRREIFTSPDRSDRRHSDDGQIAEGVELLTHGLDILDPCLDGIDAGKLVNDHAVGVGRLAEVEPELLAVTQGDALAAVALHRPHDLGYDLAVVGLRVVDGGLNDHIDGQCSLPSTWRLRRPRPRSVRVG
jgi:hypothetical protein